MQIGIGVTDAAEAFEWYKKAFGANIRMFDDEAEAALMTKYTGGEVFSRRAILALNKAGGGGFEIWQFTNRKSSPMPTWSFGQPGINAIILKVSSAVNAKAHLQGLGIDCFSEEGGKSFYVQDPYGNYFKLLEQPDTKWSKDWLIGGVIGAVIGVSDLEASQAYYTNIFKMQPTGAAATLTAPEGALAELTTLESGKSVQLRYSSNDPKGFGVIYSDILVELIHTEASSSKPLFENRFWGDLGYIHFCYDIEDIPSFEKHCLQNGVAFTVNSLDTFNMEDSGGHFTYLEDPDGTLIELIQVHRVPIMKKLGVYLDLKKSKTKKVPRWMIKKLLKRQEKSKA